MADIEMIAKFNVHIAAPYAISKAALNAAIAKFSAQYSSQGVLFLSISPGLVATSAFENRKAALTSQFSPCLISLLISNLIKIATEDQIEGAKQMIAKFAEYAPGFKGPITPSESIGKVLSVIDKASVENGDGGSFVSHLGNKQWL